MKRLLILMMFMLAFVLAIAEEHNQQTEFELKERCEDNESYLFEASSYIKLLDGFKYNPCSKNKMLLKLNRFGVFPPDEGMYGGPAGSSHDGVVGALPGTLNVSDMGAAIYTIPIQLPHGIGEMIPNLAVEYNNQAGNGLLGWAWNLTGLSSVTRTGRSKYYDGTDDRVKFNSNDRFLIDGKRLLLNCSNQYGANEATYKTEVDDMSKIVSYTQTDSDGPRCFVVHKSDGSIWEYGNSEDSRVRPSDNTMVIMKWLVNRITDRDGNSIVFSYDVNNNYGESYISHIRYTINETCSITSMYDVVFEYEERTDIESSFVYENEVKCKRLLKDIRVMDKTVDEELLKYDFEYMTPGYYNDVYFAYSRLRSIGLVADGMKLNPTTISWNKKKTHYNGKFQSHSLDKLVFNKVPFTGDFNGDGFSDVLLVPYKNGNYYNDNVNAEVYLNNGDGTFEKNPSTTLQFDKSLEWIYVIDFNGDGLSDIVPYYCNYDNGSSWRSKANFLKNNGKVSFSQLGVNLQNEKFFRLYPGDFCGEHRYGLLLVYDNPEGTSNDEYYPRVITYNDGSIYVSYLGENSYADIPDDVLVEDMDGDGKHEIIYLMKDKYAVGSLIKHDRGYRYQHRYSDSSMTSDDYFYSGDFNGDGNMDLLRYNTKTYWSIVISNGKRFKTPVSCQSTQLFNGIWLAPKDRYAYSLSQLSAPSLTIRTADFDGDGKCDVGLFKHTGGNFYMVLGSNVYEKESGGYDFKYTNRYYLGIHYDHQYVHVGNFLGQENVSILGSVMSSPGTYDIPKIVALNPHTSMYSVERITDGLGNAHGFAYDYLMPYKNNKMYACDVSWVNNKVRTVGIPVRGLLSDTVYSTNGKPCHNDYSYHNAWYHIDGHGLLGFQESTIDEYVNMKYKGKRLCVKELSTMGNGYMSLPSIVTSYDFDGRIKEKEIFQFRKYVCDDNELIVRPMIIKDTKMSYNPGGGDVIKNEVVDYDYVDNGDNLHYHDIVCLSKVVNGVDRNPYGYANICRFRTITDYTYCNDVDNWVINRLSSVKCSKLFQNSEAVVSWDKYHYDDPRNPYHITEKQSIPNANGDINDPLTVTTTYTYDEVGNVVGQSCSSPSASLEKVTSVGYSPVNEYRYPMSMVNENGWTTTLSYDDCFGLSKRIVDYNMYEMTTNDDALGLTSVINTPDGMKTIKTKRWAAGHKYATVNSAYYCWKKSTGSSESMVFYHKNGKELRSVVFDMEGNPVFVDVSYDDDGNVIKRSLPYKYGGEVAYECYVYDKYNRLIQDIHPDGVMQEYTYNKMDKNITTVATDGESQVKKETINEMGWVVKYTDIGGNIVKFDYNSDGTLKCSQIGEDVNTKVSYEYDNRGNRIKMCDPSYGSTIHQYDAFGNLLSVVSPKKDCITYEYDACGNLLSRRIADSNGDVTTTQWIYDNRKGSVGMLKSIIHGDIQVKNFRYDDMLRLVYVENIVDEYKFVTMYNYDEANREIGVTYPGGMKVKKYYSNSGHFKTLIDAETEEVLWNTIGADANGHIIEYEFGNGLKTELGYDYESGYLNSIRTCYGGAVYQDLSYSYDDFGNFINRTQNTGLSVAENFEYDAYNRLVGISINGVTSGAMEYDRLGNMLSKSMCGLPVFYDAEYNAESPYAVRYAKSDVDDVMGLSHYIRYNAFDKIINGSNDIASVSFEYGEDLNRIKMTCKTHDGEVDKLYLGDCELVTKDGARELYTYLDGPMGVFAVVKNDGMGNQAIYYVNKDHQDSWCVVTDENGKIVQNVSYDAWGNLRDAKFWNGEYHGDLLCDRGYTGHEHILALGLINMNGRLYDPMMSMMLSPDNCIQDPYFSQNYNRYRYCYNNPLSYKDPTGDVAQWLIEGIFWGAMNVIANLGVVDNFKEGLLLFGAGFVSGCLVHGLGGCSWGLQVLGGVGSSVIKAGVNNYVAQSDGVNDWSSIDKSSMADDVLYSLGSSLVSSMLNAYIVHPEGDNPGVSLGTLIYEGYESGNILDVTVSNLAGSLLSHRMNFSEMSFSDLNIDWGVALPGVLDFLSSYYPENKFLSFLSGLNDKYGFFGGSTGGNGGGGKGAPDCNMLKPNNNIGGLAVVNNPICYSGVRSLFLNK